MFNKCLISVDVTTETLAIETLLRNQQFVRFFWFSNFSTLSFSSQSVQHKKMYFIFTAIKKNVIDRYIIQYNDVQINFDDVRIRQYNQRSKSNTDNYLLLIKGKVPSLQEWGPMEELDANVHIFAATALGRGRITYPTFDRLYPLEIPGTHFTGSWVDPMVSLDTRE